MTFLIPKSHPYWTIRETIKNYDNVISLFFSYYIYRPQSLIDERTTFEVFRSEFLDENTIIQLIRNTPQEHELAIHSIVKVGTNNFMHIPMIDMSTGSKAQLEKLRIFIGEKEFNKFSWFKSGRSFHGYGGYLQTEIEWCKFLGNLLLANQKNLSPTVDPRWVGHRLISGYSALRWTKNTEQYLNVPTLIETSQVGP